MALVRRLRGDNPFTTLQVVLEPASAEGISAATLEALAMACQTNPTYLDKYYALQPGGLNGASRLVFLLPVEWRTSFSTEWLDAVTSLASVVWINGELGDE